MHDHWLSRALDILFAPRCPGCLCALPYGALRADPARRNPWCAACAPVVRGLGDACPMCAQPHLGWLDAPAATGLCPACQRDPPPWQWGRCALEMSGPAQRAALTCKTPGGAWACHVLGRYVAARLPEGATLQGKVLVPVPVHPTTHLKRGFNHACELARSIAAVSGATVETALNRPKLGVPQKRLCRDERWVNVQDAFGPTVRARHLVGKRVVLIDDVITTTSTLRAAAGTLAAVGVEVEGVLGLCREP